MFCNIKNTKKEIPTQKDVRVNIAFSKVLSFSKYFLKKLQTSEKKISNR